MLFVLKVKYGPWLKDTTCFIVILQFNYKNRISHTQRLPRFPLRLPLQLCELIARTRNLAKKHDSCLST